MAEKSVIPARKGKAAIVAKGQSIRVINTFGSQVVDTWIFCLDDPNEFQSNEHTRAALLNMSFTTGDALYTNKRRKIVTVEENTVKGAHDMLMAACDRFRYEQLGCTQYHDNCTDNLAAGMSSLGYEVLQTPSPINLFMNIPWTSAGELAWESPLSQPGDYVQFRAEMDCIFAFSACPQDILPINGTDGVITDAHFQIF